MNATTASAVTCFRIGPRRPWAAARATLLVACVAGGIPVAHGQQPAPAPRVPGFEIPPAPREPDFPLLPGAVVPLDVASPRPTPTDTVPGAMAAPDAPPVLAPRSSVRAPSIDSWDRSVERELIDPRMPSATPAADDAAALRGIGLVTLGVLAALSLLLGVAFLAWRTDRDAKPLPIVPAGSRKRPAS